MTFAEVSPDILGQFEDIVGQVNTIVDSGKRFDYSHDETEDHSFLPDVVLKPGSRGRDQSDHEALYAHVIPVTPAWWRNRVKWRGLTRSKRCCHFDGTLQ